MPPGDLEKIRAYITGYGHLYTREVLTSQLRDAGYTPADINATWAALDAEGAPVIARLNAKALEVRGPTAEVQVQTGQFWAALFGTITLNYTLAGLLASLINALPSEFNGNATYLGWGLFGVTQVIALIFARSRLRTHKSPARGVLVGLLLADIVLPLLAVTLFFGLCIVPTYFYNPNP